MEFSVITYNIHKGFGIGRQSKRFSLPDIRHALLGVDPDFLLLQEVQGEHRKREKKIDAWPNTPQCEYLANETWPYYLYARNAVYPAGHHGNAILSKRPFIRFENINLTNVHRASRSILHAQLSLGSVTLHVLCIHLGLFKIERKQQFNRLIAQIRDWIPAGEPLIMAGDFNDWRHVLSKPLEDILGVQEAFIHLEGQHAKSFPAIRPSFCVDRIYFRGLTVCDVQCLDQKLWRTLSDHLPLFARFALNPTS